MKYWNSFCPTHRHQHSPLTEQTDKLSRPFMRLLDCSISLTQNVAKNSVFFFVVSLCLLVLTNKSQLLSSARCCCFPVFNKKWKFTSSCSSQTLFTRSLFFDANVKKVLVLGGMSIRTQNCGWCATTKNHFIVWRTLRRHWVFGGAFELFKAANN